MTEVLRVEGVRARAARLPRRWMPAGRPRSRRPGQAQEADATSRETTRMRSFRLTRSARPHHSTHTRVVKSALGLHRWKTPNLSIYCGLHEWEYICCAPSPGGSRRHPVGHRAEDERRLRSRHRRRMVWPKGARGWIHACGSPCRRRFGDLWAGRSGGGAALGTQPQEAA